MEWTLKATVRLDKAAAEVREICLSLSCSEVLLEVGICEVGKYAPETWEKLAQLGVSSEMYYLDGGVELVNYGGSSGTLCVHVVGTGRGARSETRAFVPVSQCGEALRRVAGYLRDYPTPAPQQRPSREGRT